MSRNGISGHAKGFTLFLFLVVIIFLHLTGAYALAGDSMFIKKNHKQRSVSLLSLTGYGTRVRKGSIDINVQKEVRGLVGNDFEFTIDDYLQYAPLVELYSADIIKIKSKNHWFDQTKYLLVSVAISAGITNSLKYITDVTRPNGAVRSFPSGHTTFAFTNATVLFHEFRQSSPLLGYSGYAFATATGLFRIINNKHWLTDVLAGAAIGVLVTNQVYSIEPFKSFNPFGNSNKIALMPTFSKNGYGLWFAYSF